MPGSPAVQTAPSLSRSSRSTRATQPVHDLASDDEDATLFLKKPTKGSRKKSARPQEVTTDQPPPGPRYNTRSKQVQVSEDVASGDENDVEELPAWPRCKDDLPNAFNGEVEPSKDFISKAPVEIIDHVLSFLVMDHDPEQDTKIKSGVYDPRPHVLISLSAMSRLFYHAAEGFAHKFLVKNKKAISAPWFAYYLKHSPEEYQKRLKAHENFKEAQQERDSLLRRSSRLACKPAPDKHQVRRMELLLVLRSRCAICLEKVANRGTFANLVIVCRECNVAVNGPCMTLTDALRDYEVRDYMLLKQCKPGPRAIFTDLPTITYSSPTLSLGFPVFRTVTSFIFRRKDVQMIARLVHGDVEEHMMKKRRERLMREEKARRERIREFKVNYHESEPKVAEGKSVRRHEKAIERLLELDSDDEEDWVSGCTKDFCYHDIGLCPACGDVKGRNTEPDCYRCYEEWYDRKWSEYDTRMQKQIDALVARSAAS